MKTTTFSHSFTMAIGIVTVGAALGSGCSSNAKPPETPETNAPSTGANAEDTSKLVGKDPNKGNIVIGPKIMAMCKLESANFAFDSAALEPPAKAVLDALATCFVSGPAKGKAMRLVGHADPRGEEDYNFALGQKRAGAVAAYLHKKSVEEGRMETSSRGELDATGTDEASWAADRKVEIFLAE